ncbi:Cytoplasmic and mitochondrial histidine tRNA synthetase [Ophidiomyces ophidiicola]|uniref:Cytoplasmic and mitochondrial histidine tRNA synthetase n=1 Tax=Ophidiomyces ophidiicola TaxID=1387563 RepID=UPI0020C3746B|nr:Cytoplasmic and mitochondrial histidine tRNA synthetase [Ophidiomyces ophidiicola]KAI1941012.1 Cytoplasmic and mitochondrial histidine tRNA synthetase [Ophidiomyces ophidiicola]KAI2056860.1 Cytoplasmic and mitochondrial histidine tRNA synthetase [Ophidiomyces ophidiicola]
MPKEKVTFNLKTPKGTKDWAGPDALLRDRIFTTISNVFKRHGGTALDTPVFELREILAGKYGEDSKLIYDLQDQGGELCSLRYDLTVPFARWLAMNPDVRSIKRYHIAKVYRRDQPAMTKGRMREFYQCDFDIAGANFDSMVPDSEVLRIITEVFDELGWKGNYTIKVNHRKILDGLFEVCGVPKDKIRTISSAVDKLDKLPWADVRKEMVDEKGLDPAVADKIETYVIRKGRRDLLDSLKTDEVLAANASAKTGLDEMSLLMDYLEAFNILDKVSFDMSLARGLDYYTGLIYEVVTEGSAPTASSSAPEAQKAQRSGKKDKSKVDADEDRSNDPSVGVGSVAAGGRYDELVGMFSSKAQIPCVGISFGVDRIFSITKARMEREKSDALRSSEVDVYVMAFGGKGFTGLLKERMDICRSLWEAGIKAEFSYKVKPKLPQQFKAAEAGSVPFAVILGEDELAAGEVRIKEMGLPEGHPEKDGVLVKISTLPLEVKSRLERRNAKTDGEGIGEGISKGVEALEVA